MHIGNDRELTLHEMFNEFMYQYQILGNQVRDSSTKHKDQFPSGFKFWIETHEHQIVRYMDSECYYNRSPVIDIIAPYEHIKQRSNVYLYARYRSTPGARFFFCELTPFPKSSLFILMEYVVGCRIQNGYEFRNWTVLFNQLKNHEGITSETPKNIIKSLTRSQKIIDGYHQGKNGLLG